MDRVSMSVSHQYFAAELLFTLVVPDGSDGFQGCHRHVSGPFSFGYAANLEQKSIPCPLFATGEALVRSKGRPSVTLED